MFDYRLVYLFMFDWIGVVYGIEIGFVFGVFFSNIFELILNMMVLKYFDIEKGLSFYIMKLWMDFVKYG